MTNIALNLNVNFDRKVLSGSTQLTVERVDKSANEIVSSCPKVNWVPSGSQLYLNTHFPAVTAEQN